MPSEDSAAILTVGALESARLERLRHLAAECEADAGAADRMGRLFARHARHQRAQAARIRAELYAAILGHPAELGPVS